MAIADTLPSKTILNMGTHRIINVVDPVLNQDAATKAYVDASSGGVSSSLVLSAAYANGSTSANQRMTLLDVDGGTLIIDGTSGSFTGTRSLQVLGGIEGTGPSHHLGSSTIQASGTEVLVLGQWNSGFSDVPRGNALIGYVAHAAASGTPASGILSEFRLNDDSGGGFGGYLLWSKRAAANVTDVRLVTSPDLNTGTTLLLGSGSAARVGIGTTPATAAELLDSLHVFGGIWVGSASGTATPVTGSIKLANSATTKIVTIQPGAPAADYTLTLPPAIPGADGYALTSTTAGVTSFAVLGLTAGGTGQATATAAFDALSPMTTLGDTIYGGASGTRTRLAGDTSNTRKFLREVSAAGVAAAPAWDTVTKTDVGLSAVENTALSTWAGTTNITILGTIATGVWSGTSILASKGGTGASTLGANAVLTGNGTGTVGSSTTFTYSGTLATMNQNAAALTAGIAGTMLQIGQADGVAPRITIDAFATVPVLNFRRADNTAASKAALAAADEQIGSVSALGYGTTAYATAGRASTQFWTSQVWTDANQGTYMTVGTTPNNSTTLAEHFRIDAPGNMVVFGSGSALATTATDGFVYVTNMAGAPTGDTTDYTGRTPIVWDSTNKKIMVNDGSTTWVQPIPGAALTKTDDTNVTATLGGSATTSLVNAASITLGWTGTLSAARGGTGVAALTFPAKSWSGQYTGSAGSSTDYFSDAGAVLTAPLLTSAQSYPAQAGTYKNLRVNVISNGLAATLTCVIQKNGSDTAITVAFTTLATGVQVDTTHTVAFAASDTLDLKCSSTAGGVAQAALSATVGYTP